MARHLTYAQALNEALDLSLANDPNVFVLGLGAGDAAAIFGSTKGLSDKYGPDRIMDMPVSESAMTGVALGASLTGMRPVMTHIRLEFAMLAMDPIANQAAKWHYMFGGQAAAPMVIRLIVGRGWGQGAQHSQSLQAWFAHIPGLKVIMPTTPADAKGMLMSAIKDNNPVICIEHRWLYNLYGEVPEGDYYVPLGEPALLREGKDVTIVGVSYANIDAIKAIETLNEMGITADLIDVRTLNPFNPSMIAKSVKKTGKLLVLDTACRSAGFSSEIVTRITEECFGDLKQAPVRITLPDLPTPTTRALSNYFYPGPYDIIKGVCEMLGKDPGPAPDIKPEDYLDVPDSSFCGPF